MESNPVEIHINGRVVTTTEDKTVLQAAKSAGIEIPFLCYHPDLTIRATCRLCVVEIEGEKGVVPACVTRVRDGMQIKTESERLNALRKNNLELIMAQHCGKCDDCTWLFECKLLKYAEDYKIQADRYPSRKEQFTIVKCGPIEFDQSKCIDCRNCVEVCAKQTGLLQLKGSGFELCVEPSRQLDKVCIHCGQCIAHCPVGAIEEDGNIDEVQQLLNEKNKVLVVQFAPAIRTSIGETAGLPPGTVVTGQLVAALRKLGFDKVFDVSMAADFSTIEEAEELIERIERDKVLPMFTSCCPAWVKYVEYYRPDLIPHLTSVKSPQNILGSLVKTYWAEQQHVDPKNIVVVSIMPCTAKKYEITKEEARINGMMPVDIVLTTRELGRLLRFNKIDLKVLPPETVDDPLGFHTGAAVIYGATGGVMESALRTAYWRITGRNMTDFECTSVRGIVGLKVATVKIGGLTLKAAVTSGMQNARAILDELAKNPAAYHYVEIMACAGGCVGGGGQPLPVDDESRRKRAQGLYKIDYEQRVMVAHENPQVKKIYADFFQNDRKKIRRVMHTHYQRKRKSLLQGALK